MYSCIVLRKSYCKGFLSSHLAWQIDDKSNDFAIGGFFGEYGMEMGI